MFRGSKIVRRRLWSGQVRSRARGACYVRVGALMVFPFTPADPDVFACERGMKTLGVTGAWID